ncbi:MAG: sulfotransferase family protein [Microcoleaceae cyanobacterium]
MQKPNFIIIGAAKSGTTTLYQYLCRHPHVYMSKPKEPDFFSLDQNYARGMNWYSSLFEKAEPDQVCGEASTTYSRLQRHPKTVERLAEALPNVKLIYIMRHPVDCAYSFYAFRFKGSQQNPDFLAARNELTTARTFEEAIQQSSEFVESSCYTYQIERYLEVFPKTSLLPVLMEDLIKKPVEVMGTICNFIGVDPTLDLTQAGEVIANTASDRPEWYVKQQLTASLKSVAGMNLISGMLPKGIKDQVYQVVKKLKYTGWTSEQYTPPPMLHETRQMLLEKFQEPNQKLVEFLNRDLSHWNQ